MPYRTDKTLSTKPEENFLTRWSRRKQGTLGQKQDAPIVTAESPVEDTEKTLPTDADMPSIESLTEDSDYAGFLSPKVSEALCKQALRKLFHSPVFNHCDGLDDYDGDYSKFTKLGDTITADMQHQIETESRRRMQQLTETESVGAKKKSEMVSMTPSDSDADAREEILADAETEADRGDNDAGVEL